MVNYSIYFHFLKSIEILSAISHFFLIFLAITRGAEWAGRICCSHAVAIECGNACATSTSVQETQTSCRRSDEQKLFECFARQENGDNCCGNARSSECLNVSRCSR